jgi:hypothetical protein
MAWEDQGRQYHQWFGHGTATDKGAGEDDSSDGIFAAANLAPSAAASTGRYVADNPRQWIGQPSVGDGWCVALVQRATGAPQTSEWRQGASVRDNPNIKPGTAIAVFDSDGRYGNQTDGTSHAAIYLGQDDNGIYVIEQYKIVVNGVVAYTQPPREHFIPWDDPGRNKVGQGGNYCAVQ